MCRGNLKNENMPTRKTKKNSFDLHVPFTLLVWSKLKHKSRFPKASDVFSWNQ